jgi:hypothetical protein
MNEKNPNISGRYRDIPLFLILIPFINALNYYLTYTHITFNRHTLITFLIDTLEGYLAWMAVRFVIVWLDRRMPYSTKPLKRIVFQLVVTSLAGLLVIIGLTEFLNRMLKEEPVPRNFYENDIFIFLIWFLVVNGIYIGMYYYQAMRQMEAQRTEDKKLQLEGFHVKQGRQNINLAFQDILAFYVEGEYTAILTRELRKYLLDQSLDKIEQTIPGHVFFRINRQCILNRQAIKGFDRLENGKLAILVKEPGSFPEGLHISRIKAAAFKDWFRTG